MSNKDNQVYYLEVGKGEWLGEFSFAVTSWDRFRQERIGLRNRLLVLSMRIMQKLFGPGRITSVLKAYPNEGEIGVATNVVRIHKFGLTLYLLNETYALHADGTNVTVKANDRFGPIPFLFRESKEYPAVIHSGGLSSTYYMPLLGTSWNCNYQIKADKNHVEALLKCEWAQATEVIHRTA